MMDTWEAYLDQSRTTKSTRVQAKNWLVKAPRAVGKAVAAPGLLFVFDPRKDQL